jgi:formamidase
VRPLSIAALQTSPVFGDPGATLERLAERLPRVRGVSEHVQLVVLPELHLSAVPELLAEGGGYAENAAVEVPGPLTERLGELAREAGVWLVAGSLYERGESGRIHNTVPVLSPDGELVATYRKVFTWQPHEASDPGTGFVTFDIPDVGRMGLAVCYDGSFPETARQLAWLGAEAVIQPTLTTTSDRASEIVMAQANAIANQIYVVNVNAGQPAALGRSLVVDPEGLVRQQAGEAEELMTDVLDLDAVTRVREYGTGGVSRMWEQILRTGPGIELPMYGGSVRPPES